MTNHITVLYNPIMHPKGPTWNKQQLSIALELSNKLTPKEVAKKLGCGVSTVYDIQKRINDGFKPDLSPEALNKAPNSPGFLTPGSTMHGGSSGETTSKKPKEQTAEEEKKDTHPASGYIGFAAIQLRCQYTPLMYMARLAAEEKWGWSGKIAFEDFIDTILYHFFKDRGIILQGYIVEDEVDGDNAAKLEELQVQIKKLEALVTGGG